jgi:hypothetical protein
MFLAHEIDRFTCTAAMFEGLLRSSKTLRADSGGSLMCLYCYALARDCDRKANGPHQRAYRSIARTKRSRAELFQTAARPPI